MLLTFSNFAFGFQIRANSRELAAEMNSNYPITNLLNYPIAQRIHRPRTSTPPPLAIVTKGDDHGRL
jgi:hypothetical protein